VTDSGLPTESTSFAVGERVKRTPGKRVLDLLLAGLALVVLAPLLALLALIVRLDSPGPALYRQQRAGRAGKPFTMLKFRSMYHACSDEHHRRVALGWFQETAAPNGYKSEPDPRVTRAGRFLRHTSLDELPQLFNVLRGEMSLVGPRPAVTYERQLYEPWFFERESVRPGVSGLWQVSGRDRLSAREMMALDVRYVRDWSLWLDLTILARTLPAVVADACSARRVRENSTRAAQGRCASATPSVVAPGTSNLVI
jgi:lipopolysaccharide/colanic/teichoic acid biosynthesis glycosyltransferase